MWTAGEKHLSYILSARIVQVYKLEHPRIYVMVKVFYLTFLASGFEVNASSFERQHAAHTAQLTASIGQAS